MEWHGHTSASSSNWDGRGCKSGVAVGSREGRWCNRTILANFLNSESGASHSALTLSQQSEPLPTFCTLLSALILLYAILLQSTLYHLIGLAPRVASTSSVQPTLCYTSTHCKLPDCTIPLYLPGMAYFTHAAVCVYRPWPPCSAACGKAACAAWRVLAVAVLSTGEGMRKRQYPGAAEVVQPARSLQRSLELPSTLPRSEPGRQPRHRPSNSTAPTPKRSRRKDTPNVGRT